MAHEIHCLECDYEGKAKGYMRGNLLIEIILWCCFFVPGVIYSIWRWTSGSYKGCPDCKSSRVLALAKWRERQAKKSA